jgi:hypothetical protein
VSAHRLACVLLLVIGCQEAPGELDRALVNELSRTRGEAQGSDRSGRYYVNVSAQSCECPIDLVSPFEWASICGPLTLLEAGMAGDIDAVEADGLLLLRLPSIGSLTGPIEPDASFSVGAVVDLDSPVSDGAIVYRADGFFREASGPPRDEPYTAWAIDMSVRRRLVGEILGESSDCTESVLVQDEEAR